MRKITVGYRKWSAIFGIVGFALAMAIAPASAQTWQVSGKKLPVVVKGAPCNAATDRLGITSNPAVLLICMDGVWTKQSAGAISPLYLRSGIGVPSACPPSWGQADLNYVRDTATTGNYTRTCIPPSTQVCSVLYLKNKGADPAQCPTSWSQADLASVYESTAGANTVRSCFVCAAQASTCEGGAANCPALPAAACGLPWNYVLPNGASATAYATSSVPYGSICSAQTRTCNNGVLSGSYTVPVCTVDPAPASCTAPWGGTVAEGSSVTAYTTWQVPSGSACTAETRTCSNGTLSGSFTYQSCSVEQVPIYGWVDDYNSPIYGYVSDYNSPIYGWTNNYNAPIYESQTITDPGEPIYGNTVKVSSLNHGHTWWSDTAGDLGPYNIPPTCTDTPNSVIENETYGAYYQGEQWGPWLRYFNVHSWDCVVYAYGIIGYAPGRVHVENVLVGYQQMWGVVDYNVMYGVIGYTQIWGIVGYH